MNPIDKSSRPSLLDRVLGIRFLKFGIVGAFGTLINMGVLFLGQEYIFRTIQSAPMRLNASLGMAIFFATVNNFAWNRHWTWADRKQHHRKKSLLVHFSQYTLSCWVGIVLQFVLTELIVAAHLHYMTANMIAIVLSSAINYKVNDIWTFRRLTFPPQIGPGCSYALGPSSRRGKPCRRSDTDLKRSSSN